MALTRLGWDVLTSGSSKRLTNLKWITGKVRAGDAHTILNELGRRFNAEVETIRKDWSWGYAYRNVRGASIHSEHSAGTAVDFNAPAHGLGLSGTFSGAQVRAIRRILADLDGTVRWGGDYAGRKDEMHFELQGGTAKLAKVAAKINGGTIKPVASKPKPVSKPKPAKAKGTDENRSIQTALKSMGLKVGVIDGVNGPMQKAAVKAFQKHHNLVQDGNWGPVTQKAFTLNKAVQKALRDEGYTKQTVDGYYGDQTAANVRDYQRRVGLAVDGLAGPKTLKKLGVK